MMVGVDVIAIPLTKKSVIGPVKGRRLKTVLDGSSDEPKRAEM